jgi:hypothetical protein
MTGVHVNATKASPPSQAVGPVADELTILGFAVGWALIVLGLVFLGLSLTN